MDDALLRLLIERATARRDEAAGSAADARRVRDAAAGTLRTLTDYREESLGRAPVRARAGVGVEQLKAAGRFDAKLIAAIRQQYDVHAQRALEADTREATLVERQRRLMALQTLEKRRASEAAARAARRDQRAIDEHATLMAARRRPGPERS